MTHSQLDAMLAESGLTTDETGELSVLLAPLNDVATDAPAPSEELMAVFRGDPAARVGRLRSLPVRLHRGGRGAVAGAVVLAISGVGATGLSATANTLPSPLQQQVSEFSHHYLPFNFPEPAVRPTRDRRGPPAAARARKPRSASGNDVEPLDRTEEPSRSLDRPRRATKAAPAWGGREPGRRQSAAHDRGYSAPRDQGYSAPRDLGYSAPRDEEPAEQMTRYRTLGLEVPTSMDPGARPRSNDERDWTRHKDRRSDTGLGKDVERGEIDRDRWSAGPEAGRDADEQGTPRVDHDRGTHDDGTHGDTGDPVVPGDAGGSAEDLAPGL